MNFFFERVCCRKKKPPLDERYCRCPGGYVRVFQKKHGAGLVWTCTCGGAFQNLRKDDDR
jgi:hypothetical protein